MRSWGLFAATIRSRKRVLLEREKRTEAQVVKQWFDLPLKQSLQLQKRQQDERQEQSMQVQQLVNHMHILLSPKQATLQFLLMTTRLLAKTFSIFSSSRGHANSEAKLDEIARSIGQRAENSA